MKIQQISSHIYRLAIFFIIPITVWVVVEEDGVILVDTGIGPMVKKVLQFIDGLGKGPLKYILLTHGHSDHVGGIKKIFKDRKVPVFIHPIEAPFSEGAVGYPGRKPRTLLPAGIAEKLKLSAGGGIEAVGSLQGYLTPGHAPGHVVYHHKQDNVLIAGDLFWSKDGKLLVPKFSYDNPLVVKSSEIVDQIEPEIVDCCHGWPVENPKDQMEAYRAGA